MKNINKIQTAFNHMMTSQARTQTQPVANTIKALYTTTKGKCHFRMLRENGYKVDKNGIMRTPSNSVFNPQRPVKQYTKGYDPIIK